MGVFSRIISLISNGAVEVGAALSSLRSQLASLADSQLRRQTAFAIAIIGLSAKMAKADGVVTKPEVDAFCGIFSIPPGEERNVSRIYNLAKQDVAGFEAYGREVASLFQGDHDMLEAVLDGLFDIAKADGAVHERELAYLSRIADLFGFDQHQFAHLRARHVIDDSSDDPFLVLDADPSWDLPRLRRHYRRLVVENHPDRLIASGVPEEFVRIANDRLAAINTAWDRIERMRGA